MTNDGFRLIIILLVLSLFPLTSNAVIEEKSSIIGSIIGPSNVPLSGITVRLLDSFFLSEVAKTTTDKAGKFNLSNLLPGLYLMAVESPSLAGALKRVQVISGESTIVDLRSILDEQELKEHDAWDKFKWTIRVAERNPLRENQTPAAVETEVPSYSSPSDGFLTYLRNLKESKNIRGQVSYVSGANPTNSTWGRQLTQFTMEGQILRDGAWSINGNFLDGPRASYVASGDFQYRLYGHQVGATFSANDLLFAHSVSRAPIKKWMDSIGETDIEGENKLWVSSVDLQDEWNLFRRVRIDYGARIDYYGYLEQPVSYSPRLEMSYQLTPIFSLRALYYRDQSAPGNYYLQSDTFQPYIHDVAFVPYREMVNPERTVGYQTGVDFKGETYQLSVFYQTEKIADKIAAVDLSDSVLTDLLQSNRPFVIFNASDLKSRGAGARITKQIAPGFTAIATYNMRMSAPIYIIEKRGMKGPRLYFMDGGDVQQYHDLAAGIEAHIRQSHTDVQADWKWSSGSPLVFGGQNNNGSMAAVDLEVHQAVPVHFLSQSELKLLLAVKNLLDQNPDSTGNADFERALQYNIPRTVAGGVLWQF